MLNRCDDPGTRDAWFWRPFSARFRRIVLLYQVWSVYRQGPKGCPYGVPFNINKEDIQLEVGFKNQQQSKWIH